MLPDSSSDAAHLPMQAATASLSLQGALDFDPTFGANRPLVSPSPKGGPFLSLLETRFPALSVSQVVAGDSRSKDPPYAAHRWWARRPPSLMRSILLAAVMGGEATDREFWGNYRCEAPLLEGLRVHDPFMGGGTTLVEASRLGAAVSGTDVDPTAEMIVSHSLEPAQKSEVTRIGNALMSFLRDQFSMLYPDDGGELLHSFWLAIVECSHCHSSGPLYRSLVLARDCGKDGAVLRDDRATAFDPDTFELQYLKSATQKRFQGARRNWSVKHATFEALKYRCPACGKGSSHRDLQTGAAPRRLIAVERTPIGKRRKLVAPGTKDLAVSELAHELLNDPPVPLRLPDVEFESIRRDPRPRSFGIIAVRDLFTPRQLLVLGAAHAWIESQDMSLLAERAIRLALSNALLTNNRLCSYATDYGRLSPLFSIRGYSIPALPVELNPLHSSGGRGTIQQCLNRVLRSLGETTRRATWNVDKQATESSLFELPRRAPQVDVRCSSAADSPISHSIDLLVFDPPYYDYIIYDELAEPFRAWNPSLKKRGETLQSASSSGAGDFGRRFADCLRPALASRNNRYPIVFTYHSSKSAAWDEVGLALDRLELRITAMWPVRSDKHMGHHSRPGNCEWDVVVVCRPHQETQIASLPDADEFWKPHFGSLGVGDADLTNFYLAYEMASSRFGKLIDSFSGSPQPGGTNGRARPDETDF